VVRDQFLLISHVHSVRFRL